LSIGLRVEQPVSKAHANTYKCIFQQCTYVVYFFRSPTSQHVSKGEQVKDAVCEIIGRPIDNVYVKKGKNSENSSMSQLCFLFVIYLRFGGTPVQIIMYISITKGLRTLITHINYFL
jgi:hypothetical protein